MIESIFLPLFFLFGSSLMTGIASAMQRTGKAQAEKIVKQQKGLAKFLFHSRKRDQLGYALNLTKGLLLILFSMAAFFFSLTILGEETTGKKILFSALIIVGSSIASDSIFRMISLCYPKTFLKTFSQIASIFLLIFWPLSTLIFKFLKAILPKEKKATSFRIKDKILEILHDAEFAPYLEPNDQKLILSVISFKERIAREVMVPRVDMFTLNATTPVREAAQGFLEEGYSRIPVWKESVDNIIGTLYHKDLFNVYFSYSSNQKDLDATIENLIKPIVYAPETKKITQLLQEFRNKQIHLAIVVDEYGGTEGIVTIEDILEELVGEIADEYDDDEEALFSVIPSGGWIVDAKMTILDIEDDLKIQIPQGPEYDTLGGFIFQKAGTIPSKGWRFHSDEFDLEVLSSSDRAVEKVRITLPPKAAP